VEYIFDRLKAYYQDQQIRFDVVESVLATAPTELIDLHNRVVAVNEFLQQDAAVALAAANKRISNILKKQQSDIAATVVKDLLVETAEQQLFQQLEQAEASASGFFAQRDYLSGLNALAGLRPAVDEFFDHVMVMDEDEKLKQNRLALLHKLAGQFLQVADFSRIQ
jgi:glycyl-tRNA synthetase beta chain